MVDRYRPAFIGALLLCTALAGRALADPAPAPADQPQGYAATVRVDDAGFQPQFITVLPGTVVTWVNAGTHAHSVSSDDAYSFDSSNIGPGQWWSLEFDNVGNWPYHSTAEPFLNSPALTGGVRVVDGPRPTPTPNPLGVDVPYVQIDDYQGFIPPVITVKSGTMVTWENKGGYVHGVISDGVPGIQSGGLTPKASPFKNAHGGGTFSYWFYQPGVYTYHSVGEGYLGANAVNVFKGTVIVKP